MKIYEDGWHVVAGNRVYIENGVIVRGVSYDGSKPTYPYISCKSGGWDNASKELTPSAFRSRYYRGTARMF